MDIEPLKIADVGCGTGGTTMHLSKFGKVVGIEPSSKAISYCIGRGLKEIIPGTAEKLPLADVSIDLVCLLDVIEHLGDDNKALKEAYHVLRVGGLLMVTVPSYMSLWSEHDVLAGHYRRYNKDCLNHLLSNNNFKVEQMCYWNMFLFVPIFLTRKVKNSINKFKIGSSSGLYRVPDIINKMLKSIMNLENSLVLQAKNVPFGTSIVSVSRKMV